MTTDAPAFTKAYVSADAATVTRVLRDAFALPGADSLIEFRGLVIDIHRNSDFRDGEEDFLFWPVVVDVEAEGPDVSAEVLVDVLSSMLRTSWSADLPMVVASALEDQLPWSGGIDRVNLPPS